LTTFGLTQVCSPYLMPALSLLAEGRYL
jgi:hypothetical protein